MSVGLTPEGFNIKRLADIKLDIEKAQKAIFPGIDQAGDSVNGQMIGVFSQPTADLWEQLENLYYSLFISTSSDIALDYNVEFKMLKRQKAIPTSVFVGLRGTLGTVVPALTQFKNDNTDELFQSVVDTTISPNNNLLIYVEIRVATDSTVYTVTVNTVTYAITSGTGATSESIALQLVNAINASSTIVEATDLSSVVIGAFKLEAISSSFDITVDSNMYYFVPCASESINTGSILATQHTIKTIETPVSGLSAISNFEAGTRGREIESDSELRRYRESTPATVAGTLPAMISRVLNDIDGVTAVKGFSNRENIVVAGRPAKSFELIIEAPVGAPKNQEIAELIWEIQPAGIESFGNTSVTVYDSNGDPQTVKFSRPTQISIWIIAEYYKYSEEVFPSNGEDLIVDAILAYGETLTSGLDIIPQRLLPKIFETVSGIDRVVIKIGLSSPPFDIITIPIADDEIGVFDNSRISVVLIP